MMKFDHVTENNFYSIFRRFGIVIIKSRMFSREFIEKNFKDPEKYGIFPRDEGLKALMCSTQGAAAGHKISTAWDIDKTLQAVC